MRNFIKLEEEFISFLVNSERGQRNIMSFLDKYLEKTKIRLDFGKFEAEYRFEVQDTSEEVFGWVVNKVEDLQEIIAVVINLIVYLRNSGYIAPYRVAPDRWSKVHDFGRGIDEDLKLSSPFPDHEIVKLLIDYAFKEIVPLEPLNDLEKNDYISQEDRRFRRQYKQAWAGIMVAIIIGLLGFGINYVSIQNQQASSIIQDKNIKEAIEALEKQLYNAIKVNKTANNELQQMKRLLENITESSDAHLNAIELKLEHIGKSIRNINEKKRGRRD